MFMKMKLPSLVVAVAAIGASPFASASVSKEESFLRKAEASSLRKALRKAFRRNGRRQGQKLHLNELRDPKSVLVKTDVPDSTGGSGGERPNILYLVLDSWHPYWDGHHPHISQGELPLNMPFLIEMGLRGTRFTQAYVPSPFCGPSRACVAFGKEYDDTGVMANKGLWSPDHFGWETIHKVLRDAGGYHTMSCGKDDFYPWDVNFPKYPPALQQTREPTMDLGFADAIRSEGKVRAMHGGERLSEPYREYLNAKTVTMLNGTEIAARAAYKACMSHQGPDKGCDASSFPNEIYPDDFVRDKAVELLDRKPGDRPWFLQVNFPGPHHPVVSTSRMAKSVMDRQWPGLCPQQADFQNGMEVPPQMGGFCNYAAELENLDMLLYSIVKHVEELGELDNTMVVVAGDHGDNLGENGASGKGMPWHGSISTPLFIAGPGVRWGHVHEGPVTTMDLGGTWLDYAGVSDERKLEQGMTTASLRSVLTGDSTLNPRPYVSSGYKDWRAVIKEMRTSPIDPAITSYKLICCHGQEKLWHGTKTYVGRQPRDGCFGAPESATPWNSDEPFQLMLYDTIRDPHDLVPLEFERPDVIAELLPLLPEGWCR